MDRGLRAARSICSSFSPRQAWRCSVYNRAWRPITSSRTLVSAADVQFGQPVHETHPHLLRSGEITPGISALEYFQRRARLFKLLPENSVAVIPASDLKYRSGPVFYPFHQNPDFFYLTGFDEPEAVAIIDKRSSEPIFHLIVREKDERTEKWEGARSGVQAAMDVFNADESGDISQVRNIVPHILEGAKHVYTDAPLSLQPKTEFSRYFSGSNLRPDQGFSEQLKTLKDHGDVSVKPLRPLMSQLRVTKTEAEVENMRKAGKISGRALTAAMCQKWSSEQDLHAYLQYQFTLNGCKGEAYVPVIAGGMNALSIHYVRNDALLKENDLILVDAGGEYGGYAADITRTWPNSGKFTGPQRDLYEAILRVQRTCVSLCREDADSTLDKLHQIAEVGLRDQLKSLGFDVSGNNMEKLFPHHVGHYVGLDVHDCTAFSRKEKLKAGMCVTVEPGIYVPDEECWPQHFRGLGIRIEDSVCVQSSNPLILTTEAVKEVVDIEELRED